MTRPQFSAEGVMSEREQTKRDKIANRLADAYLRDRQKIARLCDEEIDRSGNLLGWLREVADVLAKARP